MNNWIIAVIISTPKSSFQSISRADELNEIQFYTYSMDSQIKVEINPNK